MPRNNHIARLYSDKTLKQYWDVAYSDGGQHGSIAIPLTLRTLEASKRGLPLECWISQEIALAIKENPKLFPHGVAQPFRPGFVYTIGSRLFIIDKVVHGEPVHAWRYRHDGEVVRRLLDKGGPVAVRQYLDGDTFTLHLIKVSVKKGSGAHAKRRKFHGTRTHVISVGAHRRAHDAGLYFHVSGNGRVAA